MKKILLAAATAVTIGMVAVFTAFAVDDFPDVSSTDWFFDAANFAHEHDFINGIGGRFSPATPVNRAQIAVMFHKYASNVRLAVGTHVFTDTWANYQLTFPITWKGYLYETTDRAETPTLQPITTFNFGLLDNDKKFAPLMAIDVWRATAWDSFVASAHPANQQVIGRNASFAIVESNAQSAATPTLQAALAGINGIKSSFRWISGT